MGKLIAANWKENPVREAGALELFRKTAAAPRGAAEVVVCPPVLYLEAVARAYRALQKKVMLSLGAQDIFWEEEGPYTGELGPQMVKRFGVRYVIVGHSERRKWARETDLMINRKMGRILADGLTPILCVGEPLSVRRKGSVAAKRFIAAQLKKDLAGLRGSRAGHILVAYEPIWAIGTGKNADPRDVRAVAQFIKKTVKDILGRAPQVLYGGSVDAKNVALYVQYKEIDGALVGGASLRAAEFSKMIAIAGKFKK